MAIRSWPIAAVTGNPTYDGRSLRQTSVSVPMGSATSARPLGLRSGVRPGTAAATVQISGSNIIIGPFAGAIDTQTAAESGGYLFSSDSTITKAYTAADASNPRRDIVYVQNTDPAEGNTGTPGIVIDYLAGTAAANPSPPPAPARAFAAWVINVPKAGGGAPTATMVAPIAVAAGGITPVASVNELLALPGFPGAYADLTANTDNTGYQLGLYRSNGTAWAALIPDSGWSASLPSLSSNWTPANSAGIRKVGSLLGLRGQVGKSNIAAGDGIFTLPAGSRPGQDAFITATTNSGATVRLKFYATGRVEVNATTGSPSYVILDGISFLTDQ